MVMIREYIVEETIVAYGYYLRAANYEEWWDNRPHHQEVPTYPHHRHVNGKIKPLEGRSIKEFPPPLKGITIKIAKLQWNLPLKLSQA